MFIENDVFIVLHSSGAMFISKLQLALIIVCSSAIHCASGQAIKGSLLQT